MAARDTTSIHFVGDQPRFKGTFKNLAGTVADPPGVTVDIIAPDGTQTTYVYATDAELVKEGVGIYYVNWLLSQSGQYTIWFKATGTNAVSDRHYVKVTTRP
jgi:hypothetical protein